MSVLFEARAIDEMEPLVLRYREAVKACLEKQGGGSAVYVVEECTGLLYSARLHEVLCICTPR